jgi:uncharacterized protein (TIGR03435 family)
MGPPRAWRVYAGDMRYLRYFVCWTVACGLSLAQPVAAPVVRAGDPAPRATAVWDPDAMRGKVVVLAFLEGVMLDDALLSRWKELAGKFQGQVEFVAVTSLPPSGVTRSMWQRIPSATIAQDPERAAAKAFGIETWPQLVVVDRFGTVAGYANLSLNEEAVRSVLEGHPEGLEAAPRQFPRHTPEPMPAFTPSYQVHIYPSTRTDNGTSTSISDDKWYARGFTVKQIIGNVWQADPERLDFPTSLDSSKRYDFAVVLPKPERDVMRDLLQQAIQNEFGVIVTRESRATDVYVMTAPNGKSPELEEQPAPKTGRSYSSGSSMRTSDTGMQAQGVEMAQLARMLEHRLGRPVVNETTLTGRYNFAVSGSGRGPEAFTTMLKEKLGLVLAPATRPVDWVVVRPVR